MELKTYFELGLYHIIDLNGYDHIVFICAMIAPYRLSDYKKWLLMVTGFTLGHSLTLVLSTLHYIELDSMLIERLIPITILLGALANLIPKGEFKNKWKEIINYSLVVFFGCIHGLGFSNFLKSILSKEDSLIMPLFGFNLGLEIGQILIVLIALLIPYLIMKVFEQLQLSFNYKSWTIFLSGSAFGLAIRMFLERI